MPSSLYDEWQNSSFAKQSPLPFYVKDSVSTCQTCHMQREDLKLTDSGAKKGQLASHRWLGANTVIPKIYGFDEQAARIVQFLQNNVFNVDIFAIEHGEMADSASSKGLVAPLGLDQVFPYSRRDDYRRCRDSEQGYRAQPRSRAA